MLGPCVCVCRVTFLTLQHNNNITQHTKTEDEGSTRPLSDRSIRSLISK